MKQNVYKSIYNYDGKEIGHFTKYGTNSSGVFEVTLEEDGLVLTALFRDDPLVKKIKYQDIKDIHLSLSTGFTPMMVGAVGGVPNIVYQIDMNISSLEETILEFRKYLSVPAFINALKEHNLACSDPMNLLGIIIGKEAPDINKYFQHHIHDFTKKYDIENPRQFKRYVKA